MQTIDLALQRAVWSRVLGRSPNTAPERETAPDWEALLRDTQNIMETYRRLSRRLWGRDAALLRTLAADEREHLQTLRALYYLETGVSAGQWVPPSACLPPLPAALRTAYRREGASAEAFEAAAARYPDRSEAFRCLAEDERRHQRALQALLGKLV